jgi:hypothetical protein
MLVGEEAESVLPAVPGKQTTLAAGSLTIEVYLRGPPTPNTVFFRRLSQKRSPSPGLPVTVVPGNSDLVDTLAVEPHPFFTPASTLLAILPAVRDCLRTRAALQIRLVRSSTAL